MELQFLVRQTLINVIVVEDNAKIEKIEQDQAARRKMEWQECQRPKKFAAQQGYHEARDEFQPFAVRHELVKGPAH